MNERENKTEAVGHPRLMSEEAEQALCGCVLLGGAETLAEVMEILGATWCSPQGPSAPEARGRGNMEQNETPFFDLRHAMIVGAAVQLWNDRKPVEVMLVGGLLEARGLLERCGSWSYLNSLADAAPTASSGIYYAQIVRELWDKRRMYRALAEQARRIVEPGDDDVKLQTDELLDSIEGHVLAINHGRGGGSKAEPIKASVARVVDSLEEQHRRGVGLLTGLRTHFSYLDKMLGGLQRKEMIVLAGRPSAGKTSLMMNIVENVAAKERVPVGVFSLEMHTDVLTLRMACGISGADFQKIRTGFASAQDFEKAGVGLVKIAGMPIHVDDSSGLDVMELRARARRMHSQHGVGLIVIDYLQLMNARSMALRGNNREAEVAAISNGIKSLAKELDIPVIVLAQLNREAEKHGGAPQLSDLRESGSIEQDADVVLMLYRKKMDDEQKEEVERTQIWPTQLAVRKQRNGPTGDVELLFHKARTRFEDGYGGTGKVEGMAKAKKKLTEMPSLAEMDGEE